MSSNEKFNIKVSGVGDDLVGRPSTSDSKEGRRKSKSKTQNDENTSSIKCYHCKK